MTIQDWGSIGELFGAIATVGTLAYLAIQIGVNTRTTKASVLQSMLDGARDHFLKHMYADVEVCDIMTRGFISIDELDEIEKPRFTCFILEQILQMQNVMQLHDAKLLPDVDYTAWLEWTGALLRTPGAQAIWHKIVSVTTPTINEELNAYLRENPESPSVIELMPVFDRRDSAEPA